VAVVVGIIIGSIIAAVRVLKIKTLNMAAIVYISFFRGTPFLVQLFLIFFGLPELLQKLGYPGVREIPALFYVFIVFALHFGAYSAEIMRSAIMAVEPGQLEAAYSIGMNMRQAYMRIILPQALRLANPALCNNIIGTLKETSLVFNVGIIDMMHKADLMSANSHRSLELYLDVAAIYIILVVIISKLAALLEIKTSGVLSEEA